MDQNERRTAAFIDIFAAALEDAAKERKLSQLKTTVQPEGVAKPQVVRIIIVPDTMDVEWSQPLEATDEHS